MAEHFAEGQPICVVLGDNIIETNIKAAYESFMRHGRGDHIILARRSPTPRGLACRYFDGERIVRIEEKPQVPKSRFALIGIYMYDTTVSDRIRRLRLSGRGEFEITDVNNQYLEEGKLTYSVLKGWWTDAGTFDSLLRANNLVAQGGANKVTGGGMAFRSPACMI